MEIWQETWFDTLTCDNNGGKNFHGLNQIEEMSSKREKLAMNMIDLKAVDFSSQNVWNLQLPISYPSSQHHFHRQRSFARVQKSSENANSQHQVQSTASTEIWHFCFVWKRYERWTFKWSWLVWIISENSDRCQSKHIKTCSVSCVDQVKSSVAPGATFDEMKCDSCHLIDL